MWHISQPVAQSDAQAREPKLSVRLGGTLSLGHPDAGRPVAHAASRICLTFLGAQPIESAVLHGRMLSRRAPRRWDTFESI